MKLELAARMGQLRRERGISQREAAAQLGISQALLSHYENGAREPKLEFVSHVCDYFDVTSDYLLGRSNERKAGADILAGKVCEIADLMDKLQKEETALIDRLTGLVDKKYE